VNQYGGDLNYAVEAVIALFITGAFVLFSMTSLRERHRDMAAWHVNLGAAIYGVLVGLIIGFVIVPMRMVLMSGQVPPQTAAISGFGFLAVMMSIRRGLIGRLPFLGPQVKAYRRAMLRKTIETAQKQLDKLTPQTAQS